MKRIFKIASLLLLSVVLLFVLFGVTIGGGFGGMRQCPLPNCDSPLLFVHRGVAGLPENSISAYQAAFNQGFNAIELDIRQSRDGTVIVFHDENGKRLLGIDSAIADLDWNSLKKKEIIGSHGDKIQKLDDIIHQFGKNYFLYLDIKTPSSALADSLIHIIQRHKAYNHVMVASIDIGFLARIRWNSPQTITIQEDFNAGREWLYYVTPIKFKPDFYSGASTYVTEDHIQFLKSHQLMDRRIVFDVQKENFPKYQKMGIQHYILDVFKGVQKVDFTGN